MAVIQKLVGSISEVKGPIRLWWLAPPKMNHLREVCELLDESYIDRSEQEAYAILWLRPSWLGSPQFRYPDRVQWIPRSTIISGASNKVYIGILFSRHYDDEDKRVWNGLRSIWSPIGGSRSSETCKVVLSRVCQPSGVVCDPYATSHILATWARRLNIGYLGYTQYQGVRSKIEKELAQVDLPGIQEELPLLMNNGE